MVLESRAHEAELTSFFLAAASPTPFYSFERPDISDTRTMSRHERPAGTMDSSQLLAQAPVAARVEAPRMQYRSRPVAVAVDPVSLVISECTSITSAIQKHARSPHPSVSAILGGNPNSIQLGPPLRAGKDTADGEDDVLANRWGLRGQKGRSMQDNPMITGFGKLRHEIAGIKGKKISRVPTRGGLKSFFGKASSHQRLPKGLLPTLNNHL